MKRLLVRFSTGLHVRKEKLFHRRGEGTVGPEIGLDHTTPSSESDAAAGSLQAIRVSSPATSAEASQPIGSSSVLEGIDKDKDPQHAKVNDEADHLAPATIKAFLRIRSYLDLTDKLEQVNTVHQGFGGYSDVCVGYYNGSDGVRYKVAVKKLRVHIQDSQTFEKNLVKEMYIWSKLDHPRILRFEGFYLEHNNYPFLVSKWMEGGTAMAYLKNNPATNLFHLCLGIAEGLRYLHNEGIIHSDIKPENVLMSSSGDPLLCDFGLSRRLIASQTFQFSASMSGNERPGTMRYMTRELLCDGAKFSEKSDVWAFGMTILSFLTMKPPYPEKKIDAQVINAINNNELPSLPADFDSWSPSRQSLWYIATFCWRAETFRPSISDIASALEHLSLIHGTDQPYVSKREAYTQALMAISKIRGPIKNAIHDDPSGDFLRVHVDGRTNMKDTISAELGTTGVPCTTSSGNPVYFASAEINGSIVPGKFSEEWDVPFRVAYGHEEHSLTSGTILKFDSELMELVETSGGDIPEGRIPVVGGREPDGTVLYHAIAEVQGLRIPGKAGRHLGGAKIGEGWEHLRPKYELLCWKM